MSAIPPKADIGQSKDALSSKQRFEPRILPTPLSRCSAVAEHLLRPRQQVGIAAIKEPGLKSGKNFEIGSPDFQNDSSLSRLASVSRRIWWVTKSVMCVLLPSP